MESEIYEIIKKIIYDETKKNIDITGIDKIPFDILNVFNDMFFDKYKECLLHNAAINAIYKNDLNYINLFNNTNINFLIQNDKTIRAKITQRALYNINKKIRTNINDDIYIKEKNNKIYNSLTNVYSLETLSMIYRKIILNYLKNFNDPEHELILDILLFSNNLDNDLIKQTDFITKEDLKHFKKILFRIILSDNYIYLKSLEKDLEKDMDNLENIDDDFDDDFDDEYLIDNDKEIIYFIEYGNFEILNNNDLRLNLYRNFIIYNILLNEQKEDFLNIKDDKETIRTLKKVNPLFLLDLL